MESSSQPTQTVLQQFEQNLKEAASILICNWSDITYAIEQGLSSKNKKLNVEEEKEVESLKELVNYIKGEKKSDIALRGELITMMVDLCLADEIESQDFEDCLLDFMEFNFNIIIEDNSAKEIAAALMRVRKQLITSAQAGNMQSEDLQKLREFNEQKNAQRLKKAQQEAEQDKDAEMQEDEEEEVKEPVVKEQKKTGPVIDDDGFEVVTSSKKSRKK